MKKMNKTLVLAMGTTLISSLASVATASDVQSNVFQLTELSSGYMQLAAADATTPAKPSDTKAKIPEAKCAGAKPISAPKVADGKCGEGKCGGAMKAAIPATKTTATVPATTAVTDSAKTTPDASTKASEAQCGSNMKKTTEADAVKK